jgi:hypothetical protein
MPRQKTSEINPPFSKVEISIFISPKSASSKVRESPSSYFSSPKKWTSRYVAKSYMSFIEAEKSNGLRAVKH